MQNLRRCLTLILLVYFLSFGRAVQKNQAAEDGIVSSYLPITLREEDGLYPIGPQGGSIVVMVMDPNDSNLLYAGSWGSGMYKSLDGGLSWQMINQGLSYLYINSLAIDPKNPAILYAGTYEHGVYKTTDGGATWAPTGPGLSQYPIAYTLAVDPVTPNVVYVGTRNQQPGPPWGGGLYKSTDGGGSWVKSKVGIHEDWVYDIKINPGNHNVIYAVTHSKGVFKSTDAAANWLAINIGITDLSTRSIVIDPTNPLIMYVGTWHYGGVFKTINGGGTWKPFSTGLNSKIYSLNMDPVNPNIIYASTYRRGIMVTDNGAVNWHSGGLSPDLVYNVMVDPRRDNTLYAGTMGDGFFISYDRGGYWANSNKGIQAASITAIAQEWAGSVTGTLTSTVTIPNTVLKTIYTSIYGGGIYKTSDLGQTWLPINNGLPEKWVHSMVMSRTDPQTLYAGTDKAGFFITYNGGATWAPSNNGLPAPSADVTLQTWSNPTLRSDQFDQAFFEEDPDPGNPDEVAVSLVSILSIEVNRFDPQLLYIGTEGMGILRSQNGGGHWSTTNLKSQVVYTILSDPFTTLVLYAGCDATTNTLYRSLDGGVTWRSSNTGIAGLTVYALAADPVTPGVIYAGTSAGLYRSVDSAASWQLLGLSGQIVTAVNLYQSAPSTIFAGTFNGLFISYDGGVTWKPLTEGLVNTEITALALDPGSTPHIDLIGTNAGGVYRYGTASPTSK